ncbi:MAG: hypothetical protein CME56_04600 [Halieaceae bacterium]|nr:hypothetical protein [Halieaceae bacterium]
MELTIEQALQQGVAAHREGKLQESERLYRAILQSQPTHPDANHNLGVLAVSVGKADAALPLFKTALEANPKIEQFWLSYIDALIKTEKFENAKQAIEQAKKQGLGGKGLVSLEAQLSPKNRNPNTTAVSPPQELVNSLLGHYQNGRFNDAEKLAISITQEFPEHPFGWRVLGALLGQTGRKSEAVEANQIAVALSPQDAAAHSNLGITLRELGRLDEAEVSLMQSLALKPDFAEAHNNLGVTRHELGRLEEALVSYNQAIALKPDFADAHYNLGNTLQELGKLEEALASCRQAIALKPDVAEAHSNLGITLQKLGRLDEAEASCRQAIVLKPDFAEAHSNLGAMLQELGRLEEAPVSHKQAIALKPDYAEAHSNLGNTLQQLGRLDEAEASFNQAIALKPDYAAAHYNLGSTLKEQDRMEESVSSFQQAFASRTGIRPVGEEVLAPATTSIYFELTNKCNFHCTFCPSDDQKRSLGSMDLALVKQLYEEASDKNLASAVNLHLMGEPTLHPKLIEVLKFGASKNIKTNLVTNISTLVDKNIPKILDALYGTITASHMTPTEETYHFRGKVRLPWDKYISNLRLLVREYMQRLADGVSIKNDITIRVMVSQDTAANVNIIGTSNEAVDILKEWNDFVAEVEQELGMVPFERKDHNADDLVRGNKYSSTSYHLQRGIKLTFWRAFTFANTRVSDDFDLKATRQSSYCYHPFTDVGVLWNGDVTLCCLDHDGELKVGNVLDSSIEAVIQSDAAQKLRASMVGDYPLPSICQKCQERPVKRENA